MSEMKTYRYDIVLSFAGEQRDYALRLAQKCRLCNLEVFYDQWEAGDIWGENLTGLLKKKYINESLFCVALFSREYCEKVYTKMEFRYIMSRQKQGDSAYIIPISMDGTCPEEWPGDGVYIEPSRFSVDEIALMIRNKVIGRKRELKLQDPSFHKATNKMTIRCDGEEEEVETLLSFRFNDTNTEYLIYTKQEADEHGNLVIYVSGVERDSQGEAVLTSVREDDWGRIKDVLQTLAQDEADDSDPVFKGEFHASDGLDLM